MPFSILNIVVLIATRKSPNQIQIGERMRHDNVKCHMVWMRTNWEEQKKTHRNKNNSSSIESKCVNFFEFTDVLSSRYAAAWNISNDFNLTFFLFSFPRSLCIDCLHSFFSRQYSLYPSLFHVPAKFFAAHFFCT